MTETQNNGTVTKNEFTSDAIFFLVLFIIFYLLIPIFTIIVGFTFVLEANTKDYRDFPEI